MKAFAKQHKPVKETGGQPQVAYEGIRRMLFYSEIVPGQKISYRDLSERLGMSQTPVIQALKWLEFQGLVTRQPHRGYYIAPISHSEVAEIYDFRLLIETDLLVKTMARIDDNGIKQLEKALFAHLSAARDQHLYDRLEKDMAFHLTLAGLAQCHVQHKALTNLFDLLYLKYGGKFLFSTAMDAADQDHQALFDAIAENDPTSAVKILSRHISRVKDHVLSGVADLLSATRF